MATMENINFYDKKYEPRLQAVAGLRKARVQTIPKYSLCQKCYIILIY